MQITIRFLACVFLATSLGCGLELTKEDGSRRKAVPVGGVMTENPLESSPAADPPQVAATEQPAEDATANTETPDEVERKKAEVGVGKKGRYEGSGMVVTPIKSYFRAQQRIIFDHIQYAMKLYQATHGRFPKTHDEFMTEIVQANNLKLPELPPGERYVYDPQKAELMVEIPPK